MDPKFTGRFLRDMPHGPAEQVSQQPGCFVGFWRNVDVQGKIPSVEATQQGESAVAGCVSKNALVQVTPKSGSRAFSALAERQS